jgi:hypothetical protein
MDSVILKMSGYQFESAETFYAKKEVERNLVDARLHHVCVVLIQREVGRSIFMEVQVIVGEAV